VPYQHVKKKTPRLKIGNMKVQGNGENRTAPKETKCDSNKKNVDINYGTKFCLILQIF
jgi:hypothetical protein